MGGTAENGWRERMERIRFGFQEAFDQFESSGHMFTPFRKSPAGIWMGEKKCWIAF